MALYYDSEQRKYIEKEEIIPEKGPVITISREYGANATVLADAIAKRLTELSSVNWKYLTHKILADTAAELNVREETVSHIFGAEEKNILGDLLATFSGKQYPGDEKIKQTIAKIVLKYSEIGHCVIVGRAGCIVAKNIPKSLHIKIIAPYDYRVKTVSKSMCISEKDAIESIKITAEKRKHFMSFFKGDKADSEIFDVIYNRCKMTSEEITESVVAIAKMRDFF